MKLRNLLLTLATLALIVCTLFVAITQTAHNGIVQGLGCSLTVLWLGSHVLGDWTPQGRACANSFGTLSGELILQRALTLTFLKFPALKSISMGFQELDGRVENALLNQNVKTRLLALPTVNNFGTGPSDITTTDVTITLNQKKEIHHQFTLAEYNATDRNLVDEQAMPIAIALAKHIVGSVAALWLNANYSRKITVASGWSYLNTLLALKSDLDTNGVPEGNRFFTMTSAVEVALLDDSLIVAALNNPLNANAIATGKLPAVSGLQMAPFYGLPGNGENLVGFAGTPDATAYAARAPKNPEELLPGAKFPGVLNYVEDPMTGFRVMVNQWVDPDTLAVNNRLVWLQGYAVGNANNGTRLVTA
jgi:hypothetical protein